ncbi:TPA: helix-turn-helix transcriptional regulator [Vibrio diabolicus]
MNNFNELPISTFERLEYIEFMLRFRGWVSRVDLKNRFGISDAAATRDIRLYRDHSQDENGNDLNMSLNNTTKKYQIKEESFNPLFELTIQQALSKIRKSKFNEALSLSGNDGVLTPMRLGTPEIDILSTITRAISNGNTLAIEYWAVKNGNSNKHLIPHSIFDNGIHWYMRAYDREKNEFRSYALTRIESAKIDNNFSPEVNRKLEDHQWSRIVNLELIPHPNRKNVREPRAIEHDFKMEDGCLKISCRAVVAGYWLAMWQVDCTEDHSLEGYQYQLWLRNHNALYDVDSRKIAPGLSEYHETP